MKEQSFQNLSPQDICAAEWERIYPFWEQYILSIDPPHGYQFTDKERAVLARIEDRIAETGEAGDIQACFEAIYQWMVAASPARWLQGREDTRYEQAQRSRLASKSGHPVTLRVSSDLLAFTVDATARVTNEDIEAYLTHINTLAPGQNDHPPSWAYWRARRTFLRVMGDGLVAHQYGDDRRFTTSLTARGVEWLASRRRVAGIEAGVAA